LLPAPTSVQVFEPGLTVDHSSPTILPLGVNVANPESVEPAENVVFPSGITVAKHSADAEPSTK
jgi:hypothetical protein